MSDQSSKHKSEEFLMQENIYVCASIQQYTRHKNSFFPLFYLNIPVCTFFVKEIESVFPIERRWLKSDIYIVTIDQNTTPVD